MNLMNNMPTQVVGSYIHTGGSGYSTPWAGTRANFYGVSGIPHSMFDGVIEGVGAYTNNTQMYNWYLGKVNTRLTVPTDVTIVLELTEAGAMTYNVSAIVGIEAGGTDRDMVVHFLRVRDQYPTSSDGRYPNSCRDHYETTVSLTAGGSTTVDHDFLFGATDWADLDNARFIVYAQDVPTRKTVYQAAVISVGDCPVTFTGNPTASQMVCPGELVQLSVAVTNPLDVTFQWQKGGVDLVDDGVHIVGATTETLEIADFGPADEASDYKCIVTNTVEGCSRDSASAEVLVDPTVPVITAQPVDVVVDEGAPAIFNVTANDAVFMAYEWRKDDAPLSDGGNIIGATTATLIVTPTTTSDSGDYDCVITYQLGNYCTTTSDTATLTVNGSGNDCPEDLSGDGTIGLSDLSALLANYGATSGMLPEDGDFDGDGDIDLSDLSTLLAVYGQDCPTQ